MDATRIVKERREGTAVSSSYGDENGRGMREDCRVSGSCREDEVTQVGNRTLSTICYAFIIAFAFAIAYSLKDIIDILVGVSDATLTWLNLVPILIYTSIVVLIAVIIGRTRFGRTGLSRKLSE